MKKEKRKMKTEIRFQSSIFHFPFYIIKST